MRLWWGMVFVELSHPTALLVDMTVLIFKGVGLNILA